MKAVSDNVLDPWEEKRAAEKELIDSIVSWKRATWRLNYTVCEFTASSRPTGYPEPAVSPETDHS
jgi:hypothetical protein